MTKFFSHFIKISPKERLLLICTISAIGWYLLMCILHLLSLRPLWNDENAVFESIKYLDPYEMFNQRLFAWQVFPRVYLFIIQQFSKVFDFHLLALRLPSFICMLSAFFIWLKIASIELKAKLSFLTFILCWCASSVLLYYSAELKQYSMDVLAASLFILFLYHQESLSKGSKKKHLAILILLPFLGFFSYPAFLFFVFPLWNLIQFARKDKREWSTVFLFGLICGVVAVAAYLFDFRLTPTKEVTEGFSFVSTASIGDFFDSFGAGTMNLFSRWFVEHPRTLKKLGIFFVFFGVFRMFLGFWPNFVKDQRRFKQIASIALVLYLELLLLGILKKYPFSVPRTSLFFCPILLCLAIQGIEYTKKFHPMIYKLIHFAFIFYLVFLSLAFSLFIFLGQMAPSPILWSVFSS